MATQSRSKRLALTIEAPLLESESAEKKPKTAAYAFSPGGRFLGKAELTAKGSGSLEVPVGVGATGVRLLVGPAIEADVPELQELVRRGAIEQHVRVEADTRRMKVELPVFPDAWLCWLRGRCLVKGTLLKRVTRDGVVADFPVCHATVEIYEVDPFYLIVPKIPKDILDRLREILVRPPPLPDPPIGPIPFPETGPFPVPRPGPDPAPLTRIESQPIQHEMSREVHEALQAVSGSAELRYAALQGSDLAFKQALVDHAALIRPIFCWFHPWLVTMQHVGTATTDDCGHFRTFIFRGCHNPDQPDLYFEAHQKFLGFFDVEIYAPKPVSCHTWWDYVCGTEVTLHTSHPLAITCRPCPPVIAGDNWVLFMAVGNHPLSRIHLGAADPDLGLTDGGAPWGGTLRPRLEFDNALRDSLGVQYYRLSWKRDTEPGTAYKPFTAAIARHYAHMVGASLVLDAYPLGPKTVGGNGSLFEIPPSVPPLGQWSIPDAVEDTASGRLDTVAADGTPLLDGKIQVRVELFTAAGAPVDIAASGIHYFVPTSTDLGGTILTADAGPLGLVAGNTMVITLHVNNEACAASIAPPTIAGHAADPCCGVLAYAPGTPVSPDSVTLAWNASHPHGFASYSFGVVRGVSGVFASSGPVGAGSFSAVRSVDHLLNDNLPAGCTPGGCPVAGFSENLYVAASATDGWSRQSQYDRSAVRAFVLAPS